MKHAIFRKYIELVIIYGHHNKISLLRRFSQRVRIYSRYYIGHLYCLAKTNLDWLIVFSLFCVSCESLKMTRIAKTEINQYILCDNFQSIIAIDNGNDALGFRIRIREYPVNSSSFIVSEIRVRQRSKDIDPLNDFKVIQKDLSEGGIFSYAGTTWKILKIGKHGIQVWNQSQPSCLGGFVYIEKIK